MRNILTSDPTDPDSYINKPENAKYRALRRRVSISAPTARRSKFRQPNPGPEPDSSRRPTATSNKRWRRKPATKARRPLALYFLKKASSITSPFQLLADKALLQFTQTALSLPTSMSNADIDVQAAMITKKLNLHDLQDPAKLNKLIAQFAALYDVNNSDVESTSPVLQLLQGSSSSSPRDHHDRSLRSRLNA